MRQNESLGRVDRGGASVRRSDGQWPRTLTAGYVYYRDIFEADPNTSTAWTSGGVNGMQIGPEVVT